MARGLDYPGRHRHLRAAELTVPLRAPVRALPCCIAALLMLLGLRRGPGRGPTARAHGEPGGTWDWRGYGYDAQHTFHGRTTLKKTDIPRLAPAWSFRTGDAVTATPTVVRGTVFAGSWDGWFYAVDLRTGHLRWKFHLRPQPAVKPVPGVKPRAYDSDGGLVTSSAWFEPGSGDRPDLVLFGGGYTLYALDARTGREVWAHDYTGRPERPPEPAKDQHPHLLFAGRGRREGDRRAVQRRGGRTAGIRRGGVARHRPAAVDPRDGPRRSRAGPSTTAAATSGRRPPSPPTSGLIYLDSSDCHFGNTVGDSEAIFALRIADGDASLDLPSAVESMSDATTTSGPASTSASTPTAPPTSSARAARTAPTTRSIPAPATLRWKHQRGVRRSRRRVHRHDRLRRHAGVRLDRDRRLRQLRRRRLGGALRSRQPTRQLSTRSRARTPSTPEPAPIAWQARRRPVVRADHRGRRHDVQRRRARSRCCRSATPSSGAAARPGAPPGSVLVGDRHRGQRHRVRNRRGPSGLARRHHRLHTGRCRSRGPRELTVTPGFRARDRAGVRDGRR